MVLFAKEWKASKMRLIIPKLTIEEINKLLRNNQSYLCRARADLLKLTDEIKKIQKANRIKNLMQVPRRIERRNK